MKRILIGILAGSLILGSVAASSAVGPFVSREYRQEARIQQGLQSGKITPSEYRALQHEQAAIEKNRRLAWADGKMTPGEAGRLTRMQDRASRHIYLDKHNNRVR
jgi:hypothetical protein